MPLLQDREMWIPLASTDWMSRVSPHYCLFCCTFHHTLLQKYNSIITFSFYRPNFERIKKTEEKNFKSNFYTCWGSFINSTYGRQTCVYGHSHTSLAFITLDVSYVRHRTPQLPTARTAENCTAIFKQGSAIINLAWPYDSTKSHVRSDIVHVNVSWNFWCRTAKS